MAALNDAPTEQQVTLAGIEVELRRGGTGTPLLVLHGELGVPGWLDAYRDLAETFDVIVPSLPGYGGSERPDWIMGPRDIAAWITWLARGSRHRGAGEPRRMLVGWLGCCRNRDHRAAVHR